MKRVRHSGQQGTMIIAIGLLAAVLAPSAGAEEPSLWQKIVGTNGQAVAEDFTPPTPSRFEVVLEMGDVDQARAWLDGGLDPNFMSDRLGSGMMIGAWIGSIPMMELFLARGGDINKANSSGEQALLLATWQGQQGAVEWLLSHGAKLNREAGKWSALHYAAFSGRKVLVEYLLERGANINARSPNGSSPLMMAIYDGKPEVAKLLIEKGADREIRNDWGDGAMSWAMKFNQIQVARMIGSAEEFAEAANQPKETWGKDARSEKAPADLEQLLKSRRVLISKGLPVDEIDRNIAALRARYAKAAIKQDALPPRSSALEITARRDKPSLQGARIIQDPGSYRLPPQAPKKVPARREP